METKNISRQDTQVKEYLERGYAELEKSNWEFAKISFDKVISLDANCGKAYVGRALAKTKISDFDVSKYPAGVMRTFFENVYSNFGKVEKNRKLIYSDDNLRNRLCQAAYTTVNNLIEEERVEAANIVLEGLNYCLGGYKDSKEKLKICEDYFNLKRNIYKINRDTEYDDYREKDVIEKITTFDNEMRNRKKGLKYGILFLLWIFISMIPLALIPSSLQSNESVEMVVMTIYTVVAIVGYITFGILTFKYGYDGAYGYAILAIIFVFYGGIFAVCGIVSKINKLKSEYDIVALKRTLEDIKSKKEIALYKIQTMLGDDIATFEYEAEALGFMVGYGKALVEKYTTI